MANKVSIINQALGFLGANRITSIDDNSSTAILSKDLYDDTRDACLEEGDWSFAFRRYVLPQSVDKPAFGGQNKYPLPDDILRVIEVNENKYEWTLEERCIFTLQGMCQVTCIVKITDPNKMSAMFRQAFAARLAWDMALPITNSKTMYESMFNLYKQKIDYARANDGMQGTTKLVKSGRFTNARAGGSNFAGPYV